MNNTLLSTFWRHRGLTYELIKREFSGRYRGTFGGVLWSLVQPLVMLAIYTIAFGVVMRAQWGFSGGTVNYALMLFVGLIVFNVFAECLNRSPSLVVDNPNFVKKVPFPLELLSVVMVVVALGHALIGLLVWLVGYALLIGLPHLTVILSALILLVFLPVLLGLGWLFSALGVVVRDISQLTAMLGHAMLFLTPIFYSIDAAPPLLAHLLMLNPVTFIVEQLRSVLYYGQLPALKGLLIYFALASLFAWTSLAVFRRLRPGFADMV